MTNFTYEEKQIAIKMLEDLMAHEVECTRKLFGAFNSHLHAVPSNLIREKIKQIKTVTFGDIKNQVGTKFKAHDGITFSIYKINGGDCMVANADLNILYPLDTFNDQLPVEVINETEAE